MLNLETGAQFHTRPRGRGRTRTRCCAEATMERPCVAVAQSGSVTRSRKSIAQCLRREELLMYRKIGFWRPNWGRARRVYERVREGNPILVDEEVK